ncbi:MAG: hypothetical protein JXB40_04900, partial [Candidatus Omnitrophica bacterium]|nr:hypothetical protein [Candidatus Omnitrophota bacterium]
YLAGIVAIVLLGFFIYANLKHKKDSKEGRCSCHSADEKPFRTDEDLASYNKPIDDKHSHVDFDDAE